MKDYSLWLFLDLTAYESGNSAKVIEKICKDSPEYRGRSGKRIYFEFDNKHDKANFIFTVVSMLNNQNYKWDFLKEEDPNTPKPKDHEKETRIKHTNIIPKWGSINKKIKRPRVGTRIRRF